MAYGQFAKIKVVNVFDSDEDILLGSFKPAHNSELKHIRSEILIHGNLSSSERFRIKIGLTDDSTAAYATSDWVLASAFDDSSASKDWIGWVRFDFNRENINKNETYNVWLEIDNYTRNADTFYAGVIFDYPFPTYADDSAHENSTWGFQWFSYFE